MFIRVSGVVSVLCGVALAQPSGPTVFVGNDGNLEGSVSSFRIDDDGTPILMQKLVTGARGSLTENEPGANVIAIDVSPDGRHVATGHASGSSNGDYVSIIGVDEEGTMVLEAQYLLPETTFSLAWIDDAHLVVTQTSLSRTNELLLFAYDAESMTLSELDRVDCGTFATRVVKDPARLYVYVNDSGTSDKIYTIDVDVDAGTLNLVQTLSLPMYPLGIEVGPNGAYVYAAGGISSGGHAFSAYSTSADGSLHAVPGSPFTSPGQSPKGFSVDPTGSVLFVQHGTDSTLRSFLIDSKTGVPTSTGHSFDVGLQGTLGGSDTYGEYVFVTDDSTALDGLTGLYSLHVDLASGAMTPVTAVPVDSTGISPESVVTWAPVACRVDVVHDGVLNFFDVAAFLQLFSDHDPQADFTGDGEFNFFDVSAFLDEFSEGCP